MDGLDFLKLIFFKEYLNYLFFYENVEIWLQIVLEIHRLRKFSVESD